MTRLASLPMYDLPPVRRQTGAWWRGLAAALRREGLQDVPETLSGGERGRRIWRSADLLLSQTCGYPLTHAYADALRPVATPCYDAPGCTGARYSSFLLVRRDTAGTELAALRGARCAVNADDSQSGCNALAHAAAKAGSGPFFSEVVWTGAHVESIRAVADGRADICAVDCVTHALLSRHAPDALADTRVLARTASAPALPYVTAAGQDDDTVAALRRALGAACAAPDLEQVRRDLLIAGFDVLPSGAYDEILAMEQEARQGGTLPLA